MLKLSILSVTLNCAVCSRPRRIQMRSSAPDKKRSPRLVVGSAATSRHQACRGRACATRRRCQTRRFRISRQPRTIKSSWTTWASLSRNLKRFYFTAKVEFSVEWINFTKILMLNYIIPRSLINISWASLKFSTRKCTHLLRLADFVLSLSSKWNC